MGTKSRETIYGASVRAAAERAREARKEANRLTCEAWNKRMLAFQGPAQPSPTLGDALNAPVSGGKNPVPGGAWEDFWKMPRRTNASTDVCG